MAFHLFFDLVDIQEKMKERLRRYEIEMKKRQEKLNELEDSA